MPHGFVRRVCDQIKAVIKPGAIAISLIKGFGELPDIGIELISDVIKYSLNIDVSVLMGANLANEVADGNFCETTIGCKIPHEGEILRTLFHTANFRVTVVPDVYTVEICGALKVRNHNNEIFDNSLPLKGAHIEDKFSLISV